MNNDFEKKARDIIDDVKDDSNSFTKKEIEDGKVMSILSYIGILVLIPYFGDKNNKYVNYHAKQGMNLFIIELAFSILLSIVNFAFLGKLSWIVSIFGGIVGLLFFALSINGIINVCNDKAKELPIVNKIKIIK